MQLSVARSDHHSVIALDGRLDSTTSGAAETRLNALIASTTGGIVVELTGLDYMSSAGIRVLLTSAEQMRTRSRPLALCGLRPKVRQVFMISGLNQIFAIHPDRDTALASLD